MQATRGIKAAAPTDLFYPDLSPRAPRIAPREIVPAEQAAVAPRQAAPAVPARPARVAARRRRRRQDDARCHRRHRGHHHAVGSLRAFWWTVGALFEALVDNGLEPGFGVKQLAARVDLQIRRVAEGSAKVADRLRREVLYYVAIAAPVAPQVQAVQRAFKLGGLIPSAEVLSADVVRIQPLLREAREQLTGAKDAWLKAASGRAENLPKLKQTLASVHNKAADIKQRRADEAHRRAGRAARQDAGVGRVRAAWRWNTPPRCCSPRARSRTTRACRPISRSRSTRCSRASTPRAPAAPRPPARRCSTR